MFQLERGVHTTATWAIGKISKTKVLQQNAVPYFYELCCVFVQCFPAAIYITCATFSTHTLQVQAFLVHY